MNHREFAHKMREFRFTLDEGGLQPLPPELLNRRIAQRLVQAFEHWFMCISTPEDYLYTIPIKGWTPWNENTKQVSQLVVEILLERGWVVREVDAGPEVCVLL